MARKKRTPEETSALSASEPDDPCLGPMGEVQTIEDFEVPRNDGWNEPDEPPPPCNLQVFTGHHNHISLAQARTPEKVAERLAMAREYLDLADKWLPASEGVAKSCARDAVVCLCEIWMAKSGADCLALVREMVDRAPPPTDSCAAAESDRGDDP